MKIRRLFIIDPNLQSISGHYLSYARSIAEAAKKLDIECLLLGNAGIDPIFASQFNIIRCFRNNIWHTYHGHAFTSRENLEHTNADFFNDLVNSLDCFGIGEGDLLFYPTVTVAQISGIANIVLRYKASGARHEILLRYQTDFYRGPISEDSFKLLEQDDVKDRVRLSSDSERLSYDLSELTFKPFSTYPIPHTWTKSESSDRRDRLHCVVLGNARGEKGIAEIAQAIDRIAKTSWASVFTFSIQTNDPSEDIKEDINLLKGRSYVNVKCIDQSLSESEYWTLLSSADVILLPYHRDIYKSRTSGVFMEASALGKPVIVTEDTWMSDYVNAYNHGLSIADRSPIGIMEGLITIYQNIEAFSSKAIEAGRLLSSEHNADNFIKALVNDEDYTTRIPRRRRAAVFYPWGDILGRTGAALRVMLFARFMAENDYDVRILYLGSTSARIAPGIEIEAYDATKWLLHPVARSTNRFAKSAGLEDTAAGLHLAYHLLPRTDINFQKRALRLIRWADNIYVKYTYFCDLVADLSSAEGKNVHLAVYDLISEVVKDLEPVYTAVRALEESALRKASSVAIANTEEGKALARSNIPFTVIPHPIDYAGGYKLGAEAALHILEDILELDVANKSICFFVGSSFGPNIEAADQIRLMADQVANVPEFENVLFVVAGGAHKIAKSSNFVSLGLVEDVVLAALYELSEIILIPLQKGTGASIKTIEALARGGCLLTTSIGVRGFPVIDGEHCVIEDNILEFPARISELIADKARVMQLRSRAREFGQSYDYQTVFSNYGVERTGNRKVFPVSQPSYSELLPRIRDCGGTYNGIRWLLDQLNIPALTFSQLRDLSAAGKRFFHHADINRTVLSLTCGRSPNNLEELFEKWLLIESVDQSVCTFESFQADASIFARKEVVLSPRTTEILWRLFHSGKAHKLIAWFGKVVSSSDQSIFFSELSYIYALSLDAVSGDSLEAERYLTDAIAGNFEKGWAYYHRGRIRRSIGRPEEGLNDLQESVSLGGESGVQAELLIGRWRVDELWRALHEERYKFALEGADELIAVNRADAGVYYIAAVSIRFLGGNHQRALECFSFAEAGGFDKSWILFHRGCLLISNNQPSGRRDLESAAALGGQAGFEATRVLERLADPTIMSSAPTELLPRPQSIEQQYDLGLDDILTELAGPQDFAETLSVCGAADQAVDFERAWRANDLSQLTKLIEESSFDISVECSDLGVIHSICSAFVNSVGSDNQRSLVIVGGRPIESLNSSRIYYSGPVKRPGPALLASNSIIVRCSPRDPYSSVVQLLRAIVSGLPFVADQASVTALAAVVPNVDLSMIEICESHESALRRVVDLCGPDWISSAYFSRLQTLTHSLGSFPRGKFPSEIPGAQDLNVVNRRDIFRLNRLIRDRYRIGGVASALGVVEEASGTDKAILIALIRSLFVSKLAPALKTTQPVFVDIDNEPPLNAIGITSGDGLVL
ncbi:glycosyltransferase [Methylobacterium radiotolerans]